MGDIDYREFIQSPAWRMRSACLRSGGWCLGCGEQVGKDALQTHHLHYRRLGREEAFYDLLVLCGPCHRIADRYRRVLVRMAELMAGQGFEGFTFLPHRGPVEDWQGLLAIMAPHFIRAARENDLASY